MIDFFVERIETSLAASIFIIIILDYMLVQMAVLILRWELSVKWEQPFKRNCELKDPIKRKSDMWSV